jgi:predicted acetyltransferase
VSPAEIVNPVAAEELPRWVRPMATAFLGDPAGDRTEAWTRALEPIWDPERAWGARDAGQWVATLRTEPRLLSVPGRAGQTTDVLADAVTNVTVAATHRRRGLMSQMLLHSLRRARERGVAVSILIPAEWPIYGRFGYAPATLSADYVLHRSRAGSSPTGDPGRVRQVELEEFAQVAPVVFAAARRLRAGQIDRDETWWKRVLGLDGYSAPEGLPHNWLVHDGPGGPDGLVAWKAAGGMTLVPPLAAVEVWDLASATDDAYRDLWAYLAAIDMVDEVKLSNRPIDEPVRWLLPDARTLLATQQVDFTWLRVLDIPAALAARRYAIDGEVVMEVIDDELVSGRYVLRAAGDQAECQTTDRSAEVEITQCAIASMYLGGFRLAQLALSGGVRELVPGALERLDLMFSTPLPPWNATWF